MAQNNMTREARMAQQKQGNRNTVSPRPRNKKPLWRRIIKWFLLVIVAGFLAGVGLFLYYVKDTPALKESKLASGGSTIILASNGTTITSLGENRTHVSGTEVSQQLKDAVVSIEDRRFYDEPFGVDPIRIASATVYNATHRNASPQGGSTLTQQLVKLAYFSTNKSDQTLRRKAQEAWLAVQTERKYSKEQILEYYINMVYEGNGVYGMQTAAHYYFGKSIKNLTLAQTALIAGIPNAPSAYDPYAHPEAAKTRRDLVIKAMLRDKKITSAEATTAINTPLATGLKPKSQQTATQTNALVSDAYLQEVIKAIKSKGYDPYRDNLTVKTNLNLTVQKKAYDLVNGSTITFPDDTIQTGITVMDPNNGNVVAMIGNRKVGNVQMALNHATQTTRSNGSTMKPILDYGPAIEYLNWATSHRLDDSKYIYPGTSIQLYDWDHRYWGNMTMRYALAQSRNVPAVKTLETVGLTKASQFASNLGITLPSNAGLSAGIGSGISTLQVAAAYSAFSNGGTYYKPRYISEITTADNIKHEYDQGSGKTAMKSSTAYMITDMLKDVISSGTGTRAQISGLHQAGKTGTTDYSDTELANNYGLSGTVKDSWFAGYTKHYSIAVWLGYDKSSEHGVASSSERIPAQLYKAIMTDLSASVSNTDWTMPSSVVQRNGELYVKGYAPSASSSSNSSSSKSSSSSVLESSSSSSESSTSSSSSSLSSSSSSTSSASDSSSSVESSSTSSSSTISSSSSSSTASTSGSSAAGNP
ncbi:PBP1A family penicillin-binding protein [Lapidilactobacillus bayanensis]|uniref:PBP1A family penicillin-binding protein n=1 Tax=Lapidilactobacillus bayanensis TaxID=2485998 RepID=UPI000F799686|nr:PBP1A family penicillin-binding protein [Lapidilactobacillus bayanensis]